MRNCLSAAAALTDQEIIERCQSGALIDDIDRFDSDDTDPASLLNRCITLHNNGQLNLLALAGAAQFAALGSHTFFTVQHFFDEAIPKLECSALPLMQTVQALVTKGGSDGAASMPNEAFRNWCAVDLARARAIVVDAEQGDALSIEFATFALRALGDVALARTFVATYTDARRLSGLFVLGRIPQADVLEAEDTLNVLLPFIDAGQADATRCNAMLSGFELCKQFPALAPHFVPQLVSASVAMPSPTMLYNLAQVLWLQGALFDRPSAAQTLDALKATDPAMGGILHMLDLALKTMLKGSHADLALDFVTDVLAVNDGSFSLEQLKSLAHDLATGDRDRLFRLIVRWLLSGNSDLGRSLSDLFTPGERGVPFDATTAGMGLTSTEHVFLSYKALAWLFTNEVVAASIMVAALRGCDKAATATIGELVFDPLLTNYGGKAADYLRTIKRRDAAYGPVRKALKAGDAFIKALEIKEPIKELRPSEYQRSVERMHVQEMMRKAHKDAEKHSVLLNLVHRSTLLYGRKSITFVQDPGNKRRAITMDLHSFGTSFELPRSEIIDPVGLSVMLLTFRSAKPK
jgi:hypothetical protein